MQSQPEKSLRVALYARVSTDEQREGQTIDSQIAELNRFAESQGYQVVAIHKDDGWSGTLLARPALDQLRDEASKGAFDAVLVNDVDRLARDVSHLGVVRRDLERAKVRLIFRKIPGENSPTQNLLINVLGSFAEFERELIADRTRRGRRHKVEVRKLFLGSPAPYGYRYIRKDRVNGKEGELLIEPAEATMVRRIFALVDQEGLSVRQAVQRLNDLGLLGRHGRPWARSSVLRILRTETYAGTWHFNKHLSCAPEKPRKPGRYQNLKSSTRRRPRSEWVPLELAEDLRLVTRDRWERVQRAIDHNRAFSPRNSKHFYFLGGLLRCGACGARYTGEPNHGKFAYRCLARCHRMPMIRETILDRVVWKAVEEAVLKPEVIAAGVRHLEEARSKETKEDVRVEETVERALEQLKAEEGRLLEGYRLGVLTPTQLARELEGVRQRRRVVAEDRRRQPAGSPRVVQRSIADYCAIAAKHLKTFDLEKRREFLRLLVHEIVFEGTRVRIRGALPLTDGEKTDPERLNLQPQAAAVAAYSWGRNSPNDSGSSDAKGLLHFELLRPVPHPVVSIERAA